MRRLLDESVPAKLRHALPAHQVRTVVVLDTDSIELQAILRLLPSLEAALSLLPAKGVVRVG